MQMLLRAMLIDALHAALEDREVTFDVVEWARRNLEAAVDSARDRVLQSENDLQKDRDRLAKFEAGLKKLKGEPSFSPRIASDA